MNWYLYCINNPLKFIDPTGNVIVLAQDTTQEQALAVGQALYNLKEGSALAAYIINALEDPNITVTIQVVSNGPLDQYNSRCFADSQHPNEATIIWDPRMAGVLSGSTDADPMMLSSTVILAHELAHANRALTKGVLPDQMTDSERKIEEQNIVTYGEKPIAQDLGEPWRDSYADSIIGLTHDSTYQFGPQMY